jgi:AbiV family abortive infection protein
MKSERKAAVPDVVSNAERLLADAELLIEYGRFASAFVLAVLAFEEVGKALLWAWGESENPTKARSRVSFHMRKQSAMASLLLARFARDTIERHLAEVGATLEERMESIHADDTVEVVAKAMFESNEGRLTRLIEIGAVDKTKQAAAYVDHWFVEHNILPIEFSDSDALRSVSDTRRALALMSDQLAMRVGLALFRARAG